LERTALTMSWFKQTRIETGDVPAKSLCWRDDTLVDWVRGGDRWTLDAKFHSAHRSWGYGRFDGAVADPTGRWAVVHERTGTAGILLCDGKIVREIHRSPYHADAFLYPASLFRFNDRVVLAHCPDSYARIEIDDAETGERLTLSTSRKEADFFHSRLSVSPGSKRLMSAGWIWHPLDAVVWFDIPAAIAAPTSLDALEDASGSRIICATDDCSACWLDDERVLIGASSPAKRPASDTPAEGGYKPPPMKHELSVFSIAAADYVKSVELAYPPGAMMLAGPDHVVTFFGRPRVVALATGKVVHEWADIDSGEIVSSIVHEAPQPPVALDPSRTRFAVASRQGIDVIAIDVAALTGV
jgi:hypothetical protein